MRSISRRKFLATSAGVLVAGGLSAKLLPGLLKNSKRHRYVVSTESRYFGISQDGVGTTPVEKKLELPGVKFDPKERYSVISSVNDDGSDLRRVGITGFYHCASSQPDLGLIYLFGNYTPNALVALDARTLEIVSVERLQDGRSFAGHGVLLPDQKHIAVTINRNIVGGHDQISIRDASTLKEVQAYSSYGFDLHEVRLSADQKNFVLGHYGSYLGRHPYEGLGVYDIHPSKAGVEYELGYHKPKVVYPGSVTLVDVQSGKRSHLFAHPEHAESAQKGHAVYANDGHVYLPAIPPVLEEVVDPNDSTRFQEGIAKPIEGHRYSAQNNGVGICVDVDHEHNEVIVPHRGRPNLNVLNMKTKEFRIIPYGEQLTRVKFLERTDEVGGMAFHPDGKHYILSTRNGIIAFERGTHRVNQEMSFPVSLYTHSHMHIT